MEQQDDQSAPHEGDQLDIDAEQLRQLIQRMMTRDQQPDGAATASSDNNATDGDATSNDNDDTTAISYSPTPIQPTPDTSALFTHMRSLWSRFESWLSSQRALDTMQLNAPASAEDVEELRSELDAAQKSRDEDAERVELPAELVASLAVHDGQRWESDCGVIGRWFLLDAAHMFSEWRDQKEMMEMGLYDQKKYRDAMKALPSHPCIRSDAWFRPLWLPLASSRGPSLGGDLICMDLDPLPEACARPGHPTPNVGQVFIYFAESGERVLLARSLAEWMEKIVAHLEAGVYRFDTNRKTYVAGVEPNNEQEEKEEKQNEKQEGNLSNQRVLSNSTTTAVPSTSSTSSSSSSSSAASTSSSSISYPSSSSTRIGVEAFMYSSLERRNLFIRNGTEGLVYLPENDFELLHVGEELSVVGGAGRRGGDQSTNKNDIGMSAWG